jgi:hypothetical protein
MVTLANNTVRCGLVTGSQPEWRPPLGSFFVVGVAVGRKVIHGPPCIFP